MEKMHCVGWSQLVLEFGAEQEESALAPKALPNATVIKFAPRYGRCHSQHEALVLSRLLQEAKRLHW